MGGEPQECHVMTGFYLNGYTPLQIAQDGVYLVARVMRCFFAGLIWHEEGVLVGDVLDDIGRASIGAIVLTREKLEFIKVYRPGQGHGSRIFYSLLKNPHASHYEGSYRIESGGSGFVRCQIFEIDQAVMFPSSDPRAAEMTMQIMQRTSRMLEEFWRTHT